MSNSIIDLLPDSLKIDPFIVALAEAFEIELKEAYQEAETVSNFNDVDNLPEPILDYLAYQKHVDFYENTLPIEQKRGLIKNATAWHRKNGTPWAVEQVVSIIFKNAKVAEWFEYGGNPYFFRVETEETLKSSSDFNRLVKMIDSTKNKRSVLQEINIKRNLNMNLFFGGIVSTRNKIHIKPAPFKMPTLTQTKYFGGVISYKTKTTIKSEVTH